MNTETKHTPGPWKVSETENYAEIYGAIPNLPPIALVQSSPEDIRLITSAPDLAKRVAELEADILGLVQANVELYKSVETYKDALKSRDTIQLEDAAENTRLREALEKIKNAEFISRVDHHTIGAIATEALKPL
jgi:hypothetical protein